MPRVLGVAEARRERWEEADACFVDAIRLAELMGARPELARTHVDYAQMLVSRARSGDRARASEVLRSAAESVGALCPLGVRNQMEQLQRQLGC